MNTPLPVHLLWLYDGELARSLDAATWLNTASALRRSGWKVTLLVAGTPGPQKIRGIDVFCVWQPRVYLLRYILFHLNALGVILRQFGAIDVILFHESSTPWLLPLRLLRFMRARTRPLLVMDSRSLPMPARQHETVRDRLRRAAHSIMAALGNRFADGELTITERLAEALHIQPGRLWGTWPSGADGELFSEAVQARRWPGPDEPVRIIYHGALHHERQLMPACQAVVRAKEEGVRFELVLVGEGSQEAELQAFAREHPDSIRVIPPVPFDKIPGMLAQAHIGMLPFPDEEKFRVSSPIKLFEYMASGLPILATRVACHTDVVGNGEYAFWAEDATEPRLLDALRMAWSCREYLPRMGRQAAAAGAGWTWDASAAKLRKALEAHLG